MIMTLREAKAKLSSLVSRAAEGEDVIITVRGKPRARLSGIPAHEPTSFSGWKKELRALRRKHAGPKAPGNSTSIINALREDRV